MRIGSELKEAQLENTNADYNHSNEKKGLIWFDTVGDKVKSLFNSAVKVFATEDWVHNEISTEISNYSTSAPFIDNKIESTGVTVLNGSVSGLNVTGFGVYVEVPELEITFNHSGGHLIIDAIPNDLNANQTAFFQASTNTSASGSASGVLRFLLNGNVIANYISTDFGPSSIPVYERNEYLFYQDVLPAGSYILKAEYSLSSGLSASSAGINAKARVFHT
ncbi:MAG: hypothetical protein N4A33_04825 [Bacteriovoracaceae bacterium]|jgi:hypothetical protein|nr:hypothetical protein [Bacteriovoracaceae bacterium]